MLSAKYIKNGNNSNDFKTINSSKNFKRPHLDIAISTSPNSSKGSATDTECGS